MLCDLESGEIHSLFDSTIIFIDPLRDALLVLFGLAAFEPRFECWGVEPHVFGRDHLFGIEGRGLVDILDVLVVGQRERPPPGRPPQVL